MCVSSWASLSRVGWHLPAPSAFCIQRGTRNFICPKWSGGSNPSKAALRPPHPPTFLSTPSPAPGDKTFEFVLHCSFSFREHILSVRKLYWFCLKNIIRVERLLTTLISAANVPLSNPPSVLTRVIEAASQLVFLLLPLTPRQSALHLAARMTLLKHVRPVTHLHKPSASRSFGVTTHLSLADSPADLISC